MGRRAGERRRSLKDRILFLLRVLGGDLCEDGWTLVVEERAKGIH